MHVVPDGRNLKRDGQNVVQLVRWSDFQRGHIPKFHCTSILELPIFIFQVSGNFMTSSLCSIMNVSFRFCHIYHNYYYNHDNTDLERDWHEEQYWIR